MSYIDYQFYNETFKGVSLDETAFSSLAERASDLIDQATNFKISTLGLDNMHARIQLLIKKATAAQVEFLNVNGGILAMQSAEISNASIGSFSYTQGTASAGKNKFIAESAIAYLNGTGLLYSGVSTRG